MSKTIKHPNSKAIFHAKRKARPEEELELQFCDNCGDELFEEDFKLGVCAVCADDPGLRQRENNIILQKEEEGYYDSIEDSMDNDVVFNADFKNRDRIFNDENFIEDDGFMNHHDIDIYGS